MKNIAKSVNRPRERTAKFVTRLREENHEILQLVAGKNVEIHSHKKITKSVSLLQNSIVKFVNRLLAKNLKICQSVTGKKRNIFQSDPGKTGILAVCRQMKTRNFAFDQGNFMKFDICSHREYRKFRHYVAGKMT